MDYFGVLKRAWHITWKYKALWVLGLFAASSSGGGSGGSGNSTASWQESDPNAFEPAVEWAIDNVAVIIGVAVLLLVIWLVFVVLSIAARGGLISEVNQAEQSGAVSLSRGWSTGFHYWWRVLGISLLLLLPILLLVGIVVGVLVLAGVNLGLSGGDEAAALGLFGALACGIPLFILLMIPLIIAISILDEIATRYAVLMDMRVIDSIKRAWADLRGKRGTIVMWLVMLIPAILFSLVILIFAVIVALPAIFTAIAGAWPVAVALGVVALLLLLIPSAIYNTFMSSAWTVFFRRMTGMEVPPQPAYAVPAGGQMPAPPGTQAPTYDPQAPPEAPAPPAPPAPPQGY